MAFYEKLSGKPLPVAVDIARNLQAVLNAKAGYAASVEVFGIGTYDGHYGYRELIEALMSEMLSKVRAFEPRLKNPALGLIGKDRFLWVRFALKGTCNQEECHFEIFFHSLTRQVRVVCA